MHVVNTFSLILSEVTDQKATLFFYGLWFFFDWEGVVPAVWTFGLCTARPANMRGLSRTCVGIKDLPSRSATPSQSSLWRAMTRQPSLHSREWQMEKAVFQTSHNLVRSGGYSIKHRKRSSLHFCTPISVTFIVDDCTVSHARVFVTRRKWRATWTGALARVSCMIGRVWYQPSEHLAFARRDLQIWGVCRARAWA